MTEAAGGAALAEIARERSQTYWWLSDLYLAAPGAAQIAEILEVSADAAGSGPSHPLQSQLRTFVAALRNVDTEALAIEHARLFGGLGASYGATPPYESLHALTDPQADRVVNVRDSYQAAGFERIDVPAVPQDHLAVELRFMALLAANESQAWRDGAPDEARMWLAHEQAFLDRHLLHWVPQYTASLAAESREPFFGALAGLTSAALALDRQSVDDLVGADATV